MRQGDERSRYSPGSLCAGMLRFACQWPVSSPVRKYSLAYWPAFVKRVARGGVSFFFTRAKPERVAGARCRGVGRWWAGACERGLGGCRRRGRRSGRAGCRRSAPRGSAVCHREVAVSVFGPGRWQQRRPRPSPARRGSSTAGRSQPECLPAESKSPRQRPPHGAGWASSWLLLP